MYNIINSKLDDIGNIIQGTILASSLTNITTVKVGKIILPAGVWILFGQIFYAKNSVGDRFISIDNKNPIRVAATPNERTILSTSYCINTTREVDVYLYGFQDSGSTLNITECSFCAVRIK